MGFSAGGTYIASSSQIASGVLVTKDIKILAQGTFPQTGDGTYQDITTINVPTLANGDELWIETSSNRTLGAGDYGCDFDNVTGNSAAAGYGNASVQTAGGISMYARFMIGTTSTNSDYNVNYVAGSTVASVTNINNAIFNFSAAEQIFLKGTNSPAGTNQTVKYIAYLIKANQ